MKELRTLTSCDIPDRDWDRPIGVPKEGGAGKECVLALGGTPGCGEGA